MSEMERIPGSRRVTANRYTESPDGSIFDHFAGHYIGAELWQRRMDEGRGDRERHRFEALMEPMEHAGRGYWLTPVRCVKCGETRKVGVSLARLNLTERWCVVRPSLVERIGARLRAALSTPQPADAPEGHGDADEAGEGW